MVWNGIRPRYVMESVRKTSSFAVSFKLWSENNEPKGCIVAKICPVYCSYSMPSFVIPSIFMCHLYLYQHSEDGAEEMYFMIITQCTGVLIFSFFDYLCANMLCALFCFNSLLIHISIISLLCKIL